MPYQTITALPQNLQKLLPHHAQVIYISAFNNALKQYKDPKNRRSNDNAEVISHKVAWAAVENEYNKARSGEWVKK